VAETLRDRVARDVGALRDWVTATVTVPQALDRDRAVFALSLALSCAEKRAAAAAAPEAAVSARRLADLLGEVRGLHTRLLGRIDSDAETTQAQVLASLRTLEQDLIRDLTSGRDLPPDHVAQAGRGWRLAAERVIAERYRTAEDQAGQLLDRVDWDLVNKLAPHPTGTRYPRVILLRLRPAAASLPAEDLREIPALTAAATPDGALTWTAQLRSINRPVLVTAGVGAAALAFLGLPLLPVAGAAALGVLSGSLAGARHQADEARKRAQQLAGAAIPGRIADAASAARQAIRDTSAVIRTAVDAEFTALERALEEQAAPAATERDAQAEAGLDKLTDQLAAWREPQGS
jgi:hypothetical protein